MNWRRRPTEQNGVGCAIVLALVVLALCAGTILAADVVFQASQPWWMAAP